MQDFDLSLYLVTDRGYIGERKLANVVREAVEGGVTVVQLREKNADTREFIELAQDIQMILYKYNLPLIINDRLDIAQAVEADGVHLGQHDMPVEMARDILGPEPIIGLSVENMEQLREANQKEVDYIGLSPLFVTGTKPELQHEWGLEGLKKASLESEHPIVAIGNIDSGNVGQVIQSGADGVAVVSDICAAQDPCAAAQKLWQGIQKSREDA